MRSPRRETLPRREREILDALFEVERPASVGEIRARLDAAPSYSAVRAMLAKLEAKGFVRHREEGLRYVYAPAIPRATAGRAALRRLVRVFFGGSPAHMAAALLKQEEWTDGELEVLGAEIERARQERRRR